MGGVWRTWQGEIKWWKLNSNYEYFLFSDKPELLDVLREAKQRREEERRRLDPKKNYQKITTKSIFRSKNYKCVSASG